MNQTKDITGVRSAKLLMISLVVARGMSFMFSKTLLFNMGPFSLLGIRFLLAFLLLFAFFTSAYSPSFRRTPRFCSPDLPSVQRILSV